MTCRSYRRACAAFYQGIGKLEVAAVNGMALSASDTFVWERGVLKPIVFLILDFTIFCLLTFVIDTSYFRRRKAAVVAAATVGIDDDQRDLLTVIPPVVGTFPDQRPSNAVHAELLSKRYSLSDGGSVQAVRNTSLGCPKNQILGLLGPNGAGKSTMVSMMSGIETIDSGDAWINNVSVASDLDTARLSLGSETLTSMCISECTVTQHSFSAVLS
jgi:ABC-type multidrug transport system fused ATPase/permease subunit